MKRSQTQHLGELLRKLARAQNFDHKLKEVDAVQYCQEILGKTLSRYVQHISVHNGDLYIETSSSMVRAELTMLREELRNRLNERMGRNMINKVIIR